MTRAEAKEIAIRSVTPKVNPCGERVLGDFDLVEFHIVSTPITARVTKLKPNAKVRWVVPPQQ